MEVKVTVTHELGEETKKFIATLLTGGAVVATAKTVPAKAEPSKEEKTDEEEKPATRTKRAATKPAVKEVEETPVEEDEAPKGRTRRTSKVEEEKPAAKTRTRKTAAKEEASDEPVFADLSDEEKLDEIKAKITLTTKKKGGADDVREILGVFDAGRAGELDKKDYDEFYDALTRYRAGESVDEIFPEVD